MCAPTSQTSPSRMSPKARCSCARPSRSDFTSEPVSAMPASTRSSRWNSCRALRFSAISFSPEGLTSSGHGYRLREPLTQPDQEAGVDRMPERILAVEDRCARVLQELARLSAELDRNDGIERSVADRDRRSGAELELEALDCRDEAREGDERGGPRAPGSETQRVSDHRPLRKPAEHRSLRPDPTFVE